MLIYIDKMIFTHILIFTIVFAAVVVATYVAIYIKSVYFTTYGDVEPPITLRDLSVRPQRRNGGDEEQGVRK